MTQANANTKPEPQGLNNQPPTIAPVTSSTAVPPSHNWYPDYTAEHWSAILALPTFFLAAAGVYYTRRAVIGPKKASVELPTQETTIIPKEESEFLGRGKTIEFTLKLGETYNQTASDCWSLRFIGIDTKSGFTPRARLQVLAPKEIMRGGDVGVEKDNTFSIEPNYEGNSRNCLAMATGSLNDECISSPCIVNIDEHMKTAKIRINYIIENKWPAENVFDPLSTIDYGVKIMTPSNGSAENFPLTVKGTLARPIPTTHELWLFTIAGPRFIPQGKATLTGLEWHFRADNPWIAPGNTFTFKMFLVGPDGLSLVTLYRTLNMRMNKGWEPLGLYEMTADTRPVTEKWTIYKEPMEKMP